LTHEGLSFHECRYRAEFKVGEFKEQPRVSLNVIPIMETDSSRETLFMTQSVDEALADSIHSRKFKNKLIRALERRVGAMNPLEVGGDKKGRRLKKCEASLERAASMAAVDRSLCPGSRNRLDNPVRNWIMQREGRQMTFVGGMPDCPRTRCPQGKESP